MHILRSGIIHRWVTGLACRMSCDQYAVLSMLCLVYETTISIAQQSCSRIDSTIKYGPWCCLLSLVDCHTSHSSRLEICIFFMKPLSMQGKVKDPTPHVWSYVYEDNSINGICTPMHVENRLENTFSFKNENPTVQFAFEDNLCP